MKKMNLTEASQEAELLAAIDRWVERSVIPHAKKFDHADEWPAAIVDEMEDLGLFSANISPEYGGLGLSAGTYAKIVMRILSYRMAIKGIFNMYFMLALAIEKFGTPQQKHQSLPRHASSEIRGGLALTELDPGTDLQRIR